MKKLLAVSIPLVALCLVAPFSAQGAKPKITDVSALSVNSGKLTKVLVTTKFKRGNSARIVYCPLGVTKRLTCRSSIQKVYTPKLSCKRECRWYKIFRVKKQPVIRGYVVVANSQGTARKRWST